MTAGKLFRRTMPFVWAKLLLGLLAVLISIGLLAGFLALGWLFGKTGLIIMAILWFVVIKLVWKAIMHCGGYLIKAGHIAVIAEACRTGKVPRGQVRYGKDMVKDRFATTAVYFVVDKLVSGAVKQIQKKIGRLGDRFDFVPGMEAITGAAQFFVKISLGYVDECCLGWTFYNKEQGVFKSSADGVVLYTQNWKTLLKNAAWTMLKVIVFTVIIALLIFVPVGVLFKVMGWYPIIALVVAVCLALVVKYAVMDSFIMVRMMHAYMGVAPNTPLAFDLYGKLCSLSDKFSELYKKGQEEEPAQPQQQYAASGQYASSGWQGNRQQQSGRQQQGGMYRQSDNRQQGGFAHIPQSAPAGQPIRPAASHFAGQQANPGAPRPAGQSAQRPMFCGQCGARNDRSRKYCGQCGAAL